MSSMWRMALADVNDTRSRGGETVLKNVTVSYNIRKGLKSGRFFNLLLLQRILQSSLNILCMEY